MCNLWKYGDLGFTVGGGGLLDLSVPILRHRNLNLCPTPLLLLLLTALPRGHHVEVVGLAGKADSKMAFFWL